MGSNQLHFRVASPDDAIRIQQLVQAAYRAEDDRPDWAFDMEVSSNYRIEVDAILQKITAPNSAILIATDDNDVLGACVTVQKRTDELARLINLAVAQHHQRTGIGRQVLVHAEDYCKRVWGVRRTSLNALSGREALILWYIRRGYRKTGEVTHERFQWNLVTLDLSLVEMEKDLE